MDQQQRERSRRRRRREPAAAADARPPGFPVTFCGRTFHLMPPDRSGMRQMEEFVLKNRRSPLDIVKSKLDGLSPEQQEMLLRDALSRESTIPNSISQYEFAAVCDTYEGRSLLFWLMTRSTHPEMTRETIDVMFEQATEEEFSRLLADWDKMVR